MKERLQMVGLISLLCFGYTPQSKRVEPVRIETKKGEIILGDYLGETGIFFINKSKGVSTKKSCKIVFNSPGGNCGFDFLGKLVGIAGPKRVLLIIKQDRTLGEIGVTTKRGRIRLIKERSDGKLVNSLIQTENSSTTLSLNSSFQKKVQLGVNDEKAFLYALSQGYQAYLVAKNKGGGLILADRAGTTCSIINDKKIKAFVLKEKDVAKLFLGEKDGKILIVNPKGHR